MTEYKLNIKGVKESYQGFMHEIDMNFSKPEETKTAIKRIIQVKA